jgi:hypothetical protein
MSKGATYKKIDLFGSEQIAFIKNSKKRPKNLFTDYDTFTEKFEAKKTTDDCYTPEPVFAAVLDFVRSKVDISGFEIVRPFYPGGDFEAIEYHENCVVIDNPPFSIISKICKFYIEHGVKFFLFAPHLTLLGSNIDCTAIVAGCDIIYENGANVKTSFLCNIFGDLRVIAAPSLYLKIKKINQDSAVALPKYEYPPNVLTVSMVQKIVDAGIDFELKKADTRHCRGLDSQKIHGKAIFGSGLLLSEKAAAEKAAAVIWELSDREKKIIQSLG